MATKYVQALQTVFIGSILVAAVVILVINSGNALHSTAEYNLSFDSNQNENATNQFWQKSNSSMVNFDLNSTFLPQNLTADQIYAHENELSDYLSEKIRVLCMVMTYPKNNEKALVVESTWGKRCNVFYFVSTQPVVDETNNRPPLLTVTVPGEESRDILWNKTKAGFQYAYEHFFDEADWFMKADDDTYVVMENLRMLLLDKDPSIPMYFGCRYNDSLFDNGWMDGGAGYILSKEAFKRFTEQALPTKREGCDRAASGNEDLELAKCIVAVDVNVADSIDYEGKQRFFHLAVDDLLQPSFELPRWYWKKMWHTHSLGKDCCSKSIIGFHYVNATMMRMFEYLIYKYLFIEYLGMLTFGTFIIGLLAGILLTLLVQWYLIRRYFTNPSDQETKTSNFTRYETPVTLPEELLKLLNSANGNVKESCLSLNLILQFLFNELHDTKRVRRWFMKKLSVEFEELLQGTTTGKLLEQITIQDLYFGTHFPLIKSLSVKNVQMHNAGYIQELDVVMDLDYSGGFQLSISADMVLGRSAYLSVRVTRLQGQAQLSFTRLPYTHWSFAFCEDPQMDLQVESHFQGRPLPKVTSLIVNQIRRTVRKRHTLPNYKIRYKPFFMKSEASLSSSDQSLLLMGNKLTEGVLEVTVIECSRLFQVSTNTDAYVYCTLAADSASWVETTSLCNGHWVSGDVEIVRTSSQPVGLTFKQEFLLDKYENCVLIDTVLPNSSASLVDIKRGDVLVAINGVRITSAKQAARLFKQSCDQFNVHFERRSSLQTLSVEEFVRDVETVALSAHDALDDDAEDSVSTDSGSKGSPAIKSPLSQSPVRRPSSKLASAPPINTSLLDKHKVKSNEYSVTNRKVVLKKTSTVKVVEDPKWKETIVFEVGENNKFLNLCVWHHIADQKLEKQDKSCRHEKDVLLGHVSILLADIATECAFHRQGFFRQTFQLLPPEPKPVASRNNKLARHPGFDESQCYGDVTLAFMYKPKAFLKETQYSENNVSKENLAVDSEDESFSVIPEGTDDECQHMDHDFIITQFNNTVFCKFCGKKVWLKLAFQCRSCMVVCHKKCVTKFQAVTNCSREGIKLKPLHSQPEIVTTHSDLPNVASNGADVASSVLESPRTQRRLRSLLSNLASSTRTSSINISRAGSVHNLAIPSQQSFSSQSKSLPPSPQGSPAPSRKTSLQSGLFQCEPDFEIDQDLDAVIQRLLQYSNDEMLVSLAKEKGRELFANLSLEERKEKLNAMIGKLQAEIDIETENRSYLSEEERKASDPKEKTRANNRITKSNEKIQALAVLMLYYCSGLQNCQEVDESLKLSAATLVASASGSISNK
ncbi:hypothetical protein CHUAL_001900 [Chamberlinius hualienensis]